MLQERLPVYDIALRMLQIKSFLSFDLFFMQMNRLENNW